MAVFKASLGDREHVHKAGIVSLELGGRFVIQPGQQEFPFSQLEDEAAALGAFRALGILDEPIKARKGKEGALLAAIAGKAPQGRGQAVLEQQRLNASEQGIAFRQVFPRMLLTL